MNRFVLVLESENSQTWTSSNLHSYLPLSSLILFSCLIASKQVAHSACLRASNLTIWYPLTPTLVWHLKTSNKNHSYLFLKFLFLKLFHCTDLSIAAGVMHLSGSSPKHTKFSDITYFKKVLHRSCTSVLFAHLSHGVRRGVTATTANTSNLNNPLWQARNKIIVQHRLALLKYWKHCL